MFALFALAGPCFACGGSPLRGATAVSPEEVPQGELTLAVQPANCRDARGMPALTVPTRIEIVRMSEARTVLLERRPGYDVLVVDNGFNEGAELVFQAVMQPHGAIDTLREYRINATGGVLRIADVWQSHDLPDNRFRATFSRPILKCALTALSAVTAGQSFGVSARNARTYVV